jgi:hypothetical protein
MLGLPQAADRTGDVRRGLFDHLWDWDLVMMVMPEHVVVTVTKVLDGHVALDVQCLDRAEVC